LPSFWLRHAGINPPWRSQQTDFEHLELAGGLGNNNNNNSAFVNAGGIVLAKKLMGGEGSLFSAIPLQ
jgi:hypothetical protein